jgi:hypothetical protein
MLPEWTFGEAELSSRCNTGHSSSNSRFTPNSSRFTAIRVELVAASRDVLPGRQDLPNR